MKTPLIDCPLVKIPEFAPCPEAELESVCEALETNSTTTKEEGEAYRRGTLLPEGRLDLCKQSIGPRGAGRIRSALRENDVVTSLLLGTDGLGDEGCAEIAPLVSQLETLYLGCNRITGKGVEAIVSALETNPGHKLRHLWLKRNPLGNRGAISLAEHLRSDKCQLITLDLVNTGLEDEGFTALLEALIDQNRSLRSLYLGGNGLTPACGKLFSRLIEKNDQLEGLYLNVNHLGDSGVAELAAGLERNTALKHLALASNGFGGEGCARLIPAIRKHPRLDRLDLGRSRSAKALGARENQFDGAPLLQLFEHHPTLTSLNLNTLVLDASLRPRYHRIIEERKNRRQIPQPSQAIASVYRSPFTNE